MTIFKWIGFLVLACALMFALPWVPFVRRALRDVACAPDETFEWRQTSSGSETSYGFVCVDAAGRFNGSDSSWRNGEVAAMGLSFAGGCGLAAIPFGVARLMSKRRPRGA